MGHVDGVLSGLSGLMEIASCWILTTYNSFPESPNSDSNGHGRSR